MPIQHISDKMLKIMKRGADSKRIKEQLYKMRAAKDSFLRTSIIVGHPGETKEDFLELKKFLEEFDFDRVTLFSYSDEEDTTAFKMKEKVSGEVIDERIEELNEIVEEKTIKSLNNRVGKDIKVITTGESSEGEFFYGARELIWAPDIDGEILINESEVKLQSDKLYIAHINELVGDKLLAKVTKLA